MSLRKEIHLVNSPRDTNDASVGGGASVFITGQTVPESGIYRVMHAGHRLPHEVTLLRGERFPRCSKCSDRVTFEAVQLVPNLGSHMRIVLNELPEIEFGAQESVA